MRCHATVWGSGVNGVIHTGYRRFARELGYQHGVAVDAVNVADRVEIQLDGYPEDIRRIVQKLRVGPPRARVLGVKVTVLGRSNA